MTPQELTDIMKQSRLFKVPLTYQIFEAIRAMTAEQAQEVMDAYSAKKDADLLARKDALTAELQKIQAEIDAKGDVDE